MAPTKVSQPPNQQPITTERATSPWQIFFTQVYNSLSSPLTAEVAAAGTPPQNPVLGQIAITSSGIMVFYNGSSWRKYDGTPASF